MYLYTPEHYADPTGAEAVNRVIEEQRRMRRRKRRMSRPEKRDEEKAKEADKDD